MSHEIPFRPLLSKLWLRTEKKTVKCRQSKAMTPDYTLTRLQVLNHTIVIYIKCKLHEIPSIAYKVMAEDGKTIEILTIKGQ